MRFLALAALTGCGRISFDPLADAFAQRTTIDLSAHGDHACTVTSDGIARCRGPNNRGQLGQGTTDVIVGPVTYPVAGVMRVWLGEFSTLVRDANDQVFASGANNDGELGIGAATGDVLTPVLVSTGPYEEVASGQYHSCARTATGTVECWGANFCGQLGDGSATDHVMPRTVTGVTETVQIAVHDSYSCAVDVAGSVRCWGASIATGQTCAGPLLNPTLVALPMIEQLQGSCDHTTCAVDTNGGVWCWGMNLAGNIGNGSLTPNHPIPERVVGFGANGLRALQVTAGYDMSCARTSDAVYCWGGNDVGQLGVDDAGLAMSPTPMRLPFFDGRTVTILDAGCTRVCALANGEVYCWGKTDTGEANQPAPVPTAF